MIEVNNEINQDDIAIIGISFKFPGSENLDEFWKNIFEGKEAIKQYSNEELIDAGISELDLRQSNYIKAGSTINDVEMFDAAFFGYTKREADLIDPQQRVFLECAWKALEDSGYIAETGKNTIGLYAGCSANTYYQMYKKETISNEKANSLELVGNNSFELIGNNIDSLTTRVAHKLNLKGPCVGIQTYCSTSLVAVHLACQSIQNYQCNMCLAGAVSIVIPNRRGYFYEESNILSQDGHVRPFDEAASGVVFGDGVGIVVLKRAINAISDKDHIYAIIKGTAINNDGSDKSAYTAPSVDGQSEVVDTALNVAMIDPLTIKFIELHGTGTRIGDPIEIKALDTVFSKYHAQKKSIIIGSVKGNIGHLDRAAGIAGLIKTILVLDKKVVPPTINLSKENKLLELFNTPFFVNTKPEKLTSNQNYPLRASITSLGFGGTNSHAILQEAPKNVDGKIFLSNRIIVLSAKSEVSLDNMHKNLINYLNNKTELSMGDIAYTLQNCRMHFDHRIAIQCNSFGDFLNSYDDNRNIVKGKILKNTKTIFLISGERNTDNLFFKNCYMKIDGYKHRFDTISDKLKDKFGIHLKQMFISNQQISEEDGILMYLVSVYSFIQLLLSWGINPDKLVGGMIGQCLLYPLAGYMSFENVITIAIYCLYKKKRMIKSSELNLDAIFNTIKEGTLECRSLNHGYNVKIEDLKTLIFWEKLFESNYCNFDSIDNEDIRKSIIIDLSSKNDLIKHNSEYYYNFFDNDTKMDDISRVYNIICNLWAKGIRINWKECQNSSEVKKIPLPTYSFERKKYWFSNKRKEQNSLIYTDLLGTQINIPLDADFFELKLNCEELPFLGGHKIYNSVVVPGAFHISRIVSYCKHIKENCIKITDIVFDNAVVLNDCLGVNSVLQIERRVGEFKNITIHSRANERSEKMWDLNLKCKIQFNNNDFWRKHNYDSNVQSNYDSTNAISLFSSFEDAGLKLDGVFKFIQSTNFFGKKILCEFKQIELNDLWENLPGIIDSCFQTILTYIFSNSDSAGILYIPISIDTVDVKIDNFTKYVRCECTITSESIGETITGNVALLNEKSEPIIIFENVCLKKAPQNLLMKGNMIEYYKETWNYVDLKRDKNKQKHKPIILSPSSDISKQLLCEESLIEAIIVENSTESHNEKVISLLDFDKNELIKLLKKVINSDLTEKRTVLFMLGLSDSRLQLKMNGERGIAQVCHKLLMLVQAIDEIGAESKLKLVIVTQGCQCSRINIQLSNVLQSTLWGIGRTATLEYPNMDITLFDMEPETSIGKQISLLFELDEIELKKNSQLAICLNKLYKVENIKVDNIKDHPLVIDSEKTYIISGGLKGIGLEIAEYIASKNPKRLILIGKSEISGVEKWRIEGLKKKSDIITLKIDISDRESILKCIPEIMIGNKLGGVIHAAGVIDDATINHLNLEKFETVFKPKVYGTINLHEIFMRYEPDFFVIFSSTTAIFGAAGQANYSAANAFIGSFASFRRNNGLKTTSIYWGPWYETGMIKRAAIDMKDLTKRTGLEGISNNEGITAFEKVVNCNDNICILKKDKKNYRKNDYSSTYEKSEIVHVKMEISDNYESNCIIKLNKLIREIFLIENEEININSTLIDLGMDSLTAIEMRNVINKEFSIRLNMDILFSNISILKLSEIIIKDTENTGKKELITAGDGFQYGEI